MKSMPMKILPLLAVLVFCAAGAARGSGGADIRMESSQIDRLSLESQQRGARTFVNYCLNCHSARFMRYNRLTDLGLTEAQIRDNLMFTTDKVGSLMTVAMTTADGRAWFGAPPPDLSVIARVRGTEWLYNVAMPHVLAELSGTNQLVTAQFKSHEEAHAAQLAAKGVAVLAPGRDHTYIVRTLEVDTPGTLTPAQYRDVVRDLVNYLDYMSEPTKNKRMSLGYIVLLYLGVLFAFAYWMKREYWKDVH
jgi:ubiquinol-cytochrome c reductase cytochrome c1 subunit